VVGSSSLPERATNAQTVCSNSDRTCLILNSKSWFTKMFDRRGRLSSCDV